MKRLRASRSATSPYREYAVRWLKAAVDKAPVAARGYDEPLKRHVFPALGHLRLRVLHRAHIKALLDAKRMSTDLGKRRIPDMPENLA